MILISDDDDDDVGCRMYEYDVGHDRLKRLWQATAIPSSAITTQIIPQPYQEEYSISFCIYHFVICIVLNVELWVPDDAKNNLKSTDFGHTKKNTMDA